jgi:hypothetical protein
VNLDEETKKALKAEIEGLIDKLRKDNSDDFDKGVLIMGNELLKIIAETPVYKKPPYKSPCDKRLERNYGQDFDRK